MEKLLHDVLKRLQCQLKKYFDKLVAEKQNVTESDNNETEGPVSVFSPNTCSSLSYADLINAVNNNPPSEETEEKESENASDQNPSPARCQVNKKKVSRDYPLSPTASMDWWEPPRAKLSPQLDPQEPKMRQLRCSSLRTESKCSSCSSKGRGSAFIVFIFLAFCTVPCVSATAENISSLAAFPDQMKEISYILGCSFETLLLYLLAILIIYLVKIWNPRNQGLAVEDVIDAPRNQGLGVAEVPADAASNFDHDFVEPEIDAPSHPHEATLPPLPSDPNYVFLSLSPSVAFPGTPEEEQEYYDESDSLSPPLNVPGPVLHPGSIPSSSETGSIATEPWNRKLEQFPPESLMTVKNGSTHAQKDLVPDSDEAVTELKSSDEGHLVHSQEQGDTPFPDNTPAPLKISPSGCNATSAVIGIGMRAKTMYLLPCAHVLANPRANTIPIVPPPPPSTPPLLQEDQQEFGVLLDNGTITHSCMMGQTLHSDTLELLPPLEDAEEVKKVKKGVEYGCFDVSIIHPFLGQCGN